MKKNIAASNKPEKNTINSLSKHKKSNNVNTNGGSTLNTNKKVPLRKIQYYELDNVTLHFQQLTAATCNPVDIWLDQPSIQMIFVLEGKRSYQPQPGYGPVCQLTAGEHCLGYYTAMKGQLLYDPEMPYFSVDIVLPEDYLRSIFQDDLTQLTNFGKSIEKKQSVLLGNRSFPLTPAQKEVLLAMRDCQLTGQLQKLFLEGKLRELLTLQIAQFQENQLGQHDTLNLEGVDTFYTVRDQLNQNLINPPSLKDLTLLAGMNRTKLMSGFKELFGKTIYGYVSDLRMERAKELMISDKHIKVADIARRVGFKNANNFSAAFKKKFGYSPNMFR
ncbi:hypothetical protein GCM10028807_31320 [Spirosoma daeguense]